MCRKVEVGCGVGVERLAFLPVTDGGGRAGGFAVGRGDCEIGPKKKEWVEGVGRWGAGRLAWGGEGR